MHDDKIRVTGFIVVIIGFLGLIGLLWYHLGWTFALALLCVVLILFGFALMGS